MRAAVMGRSWWRATTSASALAPALGAVLIAVVCLSLLRTAVTPTAAGVSLRWLHAMKPISRVPERPQDAFNQLLPSLDPAARRDALVGLGVFALPWIAGPDPVRHRDDGLGPLFNARACSGCHRRQGPGRRTQTLIRLVPPDPVYGAQIQTAAIAGLRPEAQVDMYFSAGAGAQVSVFELAHGPLSPQTRLSPRLPPPVAGLGLLEAIDPAAIAAGADPEDRDGDGIRGRVAHVWSPALGRMALGRFGWRAEQATLEDQNAAANHADIGLSSPLFPTRWGDCTVHQQDCRARPTVANPGDGEVEVSAERHRALTLYLRHLAPPAPRPGPKADRGLALFHRSGCAACHRPHWRTARDGVDPHVADREIWPFTDLLLHDMGPALADLPAHPGQGSGNRLWRTPPLWGLGARAGVVGEVALLHDGRARSVEAAIAWHGGEAAAARDTFERLSAAEQATLIAFLESL